MIAERPANNFTWSELLGGFEPTERFLVHVEKLQELREWWEAPLYVTSGYRSQQHNTQIEGAQNSQHMEFATDVRPSHHSPHVDDIAPHQRRSAAVIIFAEEARNHFDGVGLYNTFVHLDLRGKKVEWQSLKLGT